jgi:signal-transduction protein with cAMP-binding, CBS, and nucleotidyltransferase domain
MTVGEFCTREVVFVERKTSIVEAAQLMRQYHVGTLIVVEDHADQAIPVGIITDRDIVVEIIAQEVDLDAVVADDIMSYDLVCVQENDGIWETLVQMRSKGIRRVPVVNEKGGLEGILTMDDLIELLAEELNLLAKVISTSRARERKKRG